MLSEEENQQQVSPEDLHQERLESNLQLAGFIGIEDPIRPEVPEAIGKCRRAGIDILLINR